MEHVRPAKYVPGPSTLAASGACEELPNPSPEPIWTGPYGQGEVSPTGSRPGGLTRDRAMSRSDGDANLRNIASATARHVGPRRKSAAGELRMLERVLRDSVAVS